MAPTRMGPVVIVNALQRQVVYKGSLHVWGVVLLRAGSRLALSASLACGFPPNADSLSWHGAVFVCCSLACRMPRAKAAPEQCSSCSRLVKREDGLRAWAARLCPKCWGAQKRQNRQLTNLNLKQGRTPQASRLFPSASASAYCFPQAAKKRWGVKSIRKGTYAVPRRILLLKVTHHVGSSIHVPSLRGGAAARNAVATLALCQMQARRMLKDSDVRGTWLLFVGSVRPDPAYRGVYMHDVQS